MHFFRAFALVALLGISAATTLAQDYDYDYTSESSQETQDPSLAAPERLPAQEQVSTVLMEKLAFVPQTLTVPVGATVVWTNLDPFEHTATADDASFDSGIIPVGGTYALVFPTSGVYPYFCTLHGSPGGGQAGTIVVS